MKETASIHRFENKLRQRGVFEDVRRHLRPHRPTHRGSLNALFAPPRALPVAPLSINLDLTVACNYRCPHCIDADIINTKAMFTLEEVTKTLINLRFGGLRSVILIGGGEPTAHPDFGEVVRLIKALGLECAVVSNGSKNEKIARAASFFTEGDWVRLSLDAGYDDTFQRLHLPGKPITLEAICRSAAQIKHANPAVQLGFSFIVITPEAQLYDLRLTTNYREIEQAARVAKQHHFDYVTFKPYLVRDDDGKEIVPYELHSESTGGETLETIRAELERAREHVTDTFEVIESPNLLALVDGPSEPLKPQPHRCFMQRMRQVVSPLGIFGCPAYRGDNNSLIAGKDGYTSTEKYLATARQTEEQVERFDAAAECANIACIYNSANWWLNEMADDVEGMEATQPLSDSRDVFL